MENNKELEASQKKKRFSGNHRSYNSMKKARDVPGLIIKKTELQFFYPIVNRITFFLIVPIVFLLHSVVPFLSAIIYLHLYCYVKKAVMQMGY